MVGSRTSCSQVFRYFNNQAAFLGKAVHHSIVKERSDLTVESDLLALLD